MSDAGLEHLLPQIERVLQLAEEMLEQRARRPSNEGPTDTIAYRWHRDRLHPIAHPDIYPLGDLLGVEQSVARLRANIEAFVSGQPALDTLLYGERGTGKSSAVRGLLGEFAPRGLRLVEISRDDLYELWEVFRVLRTRGERFALFCDDLSFEAGDASYKRLKAVLEGGLEARPENVLIVATSNRRHLLPELMSENLAARIDDAGELHPGEAVEEKLSLSDRFGLLLPFLAFDQTVYLQIIDHHASRLGLSDRVSSDQLHRRAIQFALDRGTRSGRTARQACIAMLQEWRGSAR